jgi:hypothetical protein
MPRYTHLTEISTSQNIYITATVDQQYQNRGQKYNHQKSAQHHAVAKEMKPSWDLYQ